MKQNYWHDIPATEDKIEDTVNAIIEIPKGSSCKYEYDKDFGILKLDRVLYTATHYPANYGFIPRTYANDNDPADILVFCKEPMVPGILMRARVIGVAVMKDGADMDEKIIAVSADDPSYAKITSIQQLPAHLIDEMTHFFTVYKELEGKTTRILNVKDREEALAIIKECMEAYNQFKASQNVAVSSH